METLEVLKTKRADILSVDPKLLYVKEGFNVRVDMGNLEELSDSILSIGQQVPLKVVKDRGEERYRIVDGHRRYNAIMLAIEKGGVIPYVRCEIFNGNSEDELLTMIATGIGQKQLNEVEQAEGIKRLIDLGYSVDELAKKIGKSVPYVYNLIKLSNLPKMVKNEILSGAISGQTVLNIQKNVENNEQLLNHVKGAIEKATNNGTTKKKATAKHVSDEVKPLTDSQKLRLVYDRLLEENIQNQKTDLLELIIFKTKELSVDELFDELIKL